MPERKADEGEEEHEVDGGIVGRDFSGSFHPFAFKFYPMPISFALSSPPYVFLSTFLFLRNFSILTRYKNKRANGNKRGKRCANYL